MVSDLMSRRFAATVDVIIPCRFIVLTPQGWRMEAHMGGASAGPNQAGFAAALKQATAGLHLRAERTGVVAEILHGRIDRQGYGLLMRNLLPAYEALESGLEHHRQAPGVRCIADPALYRADALVCDLQRLWGSGWRRSLPMLAEGRGYGEQIAAAREGDGARLIAHAYVRYFGDLSGGQILGRRIAAAPGLGPSAHAFYEFPDIPDRAAYKAKFRAALDRAALEIADPDIVLAEATAAFELNIELSEAVARALPRMQMPLSGV
jgi:heme oxygenase